MVLESERYAQLRDPVKVSVRNVKPYHHNPEEVGAKCVFRINTEANDRFANNPKVAEEVAHIMGRFSAAVIDNMKKYGNLDSLALNLPFGTKYSGRINSLIERRLVDPASRKIEVMSTNPVCLGITYRKTLVPGIYFETLKVKPAADSSSYLVKRIVGCAFVPCKGK